MFPPRVNSDNTWVGQFRGGAGLDDKPAKVGLFAKHHFQGDKPARLSLPRLIDNAHASAAQLTQQLVIAETL